VAKNLFLFTGSETYLLHEQVKKWKAAFIEKHGEFNLEHLEASEVAFKDIISAVNAMPFLGERRLIFIENLPEAPSKRASAKPSKAAEKRDEQLKKFLKDLDDVSETSVVVFIQSNPDKRKSFYKQLIKKAKVKEFKPLTGSALMEWIQLHAQQKGSQISCHDAEYLGNLTLQNLWRLSKEVDKLGAHSFGESITRQTIDAMVTPSVEANIFHLTDALGARDAKRAIACLYKSEAAGEKLQAVFYMIIRQFRLLLQGAAFLAEGNPSPTVFTAKLKLHPFVAKNTLAQARHFNVEDLKKAYQLLLQIDLDLKTSQIRVYADDQRELALALERFILTF